MSALCFWTAFAMIGSTCVFLGSCIVCGSSADRCTPVTLMLLIQHTCFSFSIYWDYALTVPLRQIVCIHCHQRCEYTAAFSPTHTHTVCHVKFRSCHEESVSWCHWSWQSIHRESLSSFSSFSISYMHKPSVSFYSITVYVLSTIRRQYLIHFVLFFACSYSSWLWGDTGSGQSGWDPAATPALSPWWSPAGLSLLSRNGPVTTGPVGAASLVPKRKGNSMIQVTNEDHKTLK